MRDFRYMAAMFKDRKIWFLQIAWYELRGIILQATNNASITWKFIFSQEMAQDSENLRRRLSNQRKGGLWDYSCPTWLFWRRWWSDTHRRQSICHTCGLLWSSGCQCSDPKKTGYAKWKPDEAGKPRGCRTECLHRGDPAKAVQKLKLLHWLCYLTVQQGLGSVD